MGNPKGVSRSNAAAVVVAGVKASKRRSKKKVQITTYYTVNIVATAAFRSRHPQSYLQGSAKGLALGCVNLHPSVRGSQEAGFTQPRAQLLADPCTL